MMQNAGNSSRILRARLIFLRRMGGGPRTFPGGLNKWQWKRLHEKKAREKEKRLLEQEKQIYQARVRSQIRGQLASAEDSTPGTGIPAQGQTNYGPLTPEQHIKVLADRFMKEGAEDLWNERDGPSGMPQNKPGQSHVIGQPIDLQKFVPNRALSNGGERNSSGKFSKLGVGGGPRSFSTSSAHRVKCHENYEIFGITNGFSFGRRCKHGILLGLNAVLDFRQYHTGIPSGTILENPKFLKNRRISVTDNHSNTEEKSHSGKGVRWPKFHGKEITSSDDDDDDSDGENVRMESKWKVVGSSASLGKYDIKTKKRVPLKFLENEVDLSQQVEEIRKEVAQRRSVKEDNLQDLQDPPLLSTKRFGECNVSELTVRALTEAGYVLMTRVQEETLAACLDGKDAIFKARAGTGKSIAFLLPAIETVLNPSKSFDYTNQRVPPIHVLILCPTRELASQLSAEANVLLKHHNGIGLQTLIGGTRFKVDQRRLESDPCQIVVATPGRLLDHIENKSSVSVRLMALQMLILDEADHLLSLGFRKDIEKILDCLPRKRQSLLFSATIPKEVRRISQLVLKREHVYVDTVGLGCLETNPVVKQSYVVAPHGKHFEIVYCIIKKHISEIPDYKVIVFCGTAMMTSFLFSILHEMRLNVRELHTKKCPLYRARVSDEFKDSKQLILITSDVSTRGVNYPDVSLVIQMGIPYDRGHYIHRVGRTGRQGKEGEAILVVSPWEQYFVKELKDLPLEKLDAENFHDCDAKAKIEESMKKVDTSVKEGAYHAWLGYYNSIHAISRDKTSLVEAANKFAASIGLEKAPAMYRKTAVKMGLKGIAGIRLKS